MADCTHFSPLISIIMRGMNERMVKASHRKKEGKRERDYEWMNSCNNFSKIEVVGNVEGPRKDRSHGHACMGPTVWVAIGLGMALESNRFEQGDVAETEMRSGAEPQGVNIEQSLYPWEA